MRERPDVPFPLDGGEEGPGQLQHGASVVAAAAAAAAALSEGEAQDGDAEAQALLAHTLEEVSLAMDALGNEFAAAQEAFCRDTPRRTTDGG